MGKFRTNADCVIWPKLEPMECLTWIFLSSEFACFVAGEIIEVREAMPGSVVPLAMFCWKVRRIRVMIYVWGIVLHREREKGRTWILFLHQYTTHIAHIHSYWYPYHIHQSTIYTLLIYMMFLLISIAHIHMNVHIHIHHSHCSYIWYSYWYPLLIYT